MGHLHENGGIETEDLSFTTGRRRLKELIRPDGTREAVSFEAWAFHVLRNPFSPTTRKAVEVKDPDLEKLKDVKAIVIEASQLPVVDPVEKKVEIPRQQVQDDQSFSNLKVEEAQRIGFRSAEAGKTDRGGRR